MSRLLLIGFFVLSSVCFSSIVRADCENAVLRDVCERMEARERAKARAEEREEAKERARQLREDRELASEKREQASKKSENVYCARGNPLCEKGEYYGPELPPWDRNTGVKLEDYPADPYGYRFGPKYRSATPDNRALTDDMMENKLLQNQLDGAPLQGGSTIGRPQVKNSGVSGTTTSPTLKK